MEGIETPYILMGNHNSYYDLMVLEKAILPNRCNYIVATGTYSFECPARVDALPNAKGYIDLGMGKLIHDMNGFKLTGKYKDEEYEVVLLAKDHYSVHIEYEYLGKFGDCVDLNTLNDTFYVYPKCEKFSVTKMSLACEELYKYLNNGK